MPTSGEHWLDRPPPRGRESYAIHPLLALDGVLLYVTCRGEAVGSYFGVDEEAAAEAAACDLGDTLLHDGTSA